MSLYIMVNIVCQYKKRQQLQLFKMKQNLGKTISHPAETAMDSLEVLRALASRENISSAQMTCGYSLALLDKSFTPIKISFLSVHAT